MPIYEYRCTDCSHKLEAIQRFSDSPLTTCPACGKETLSKLVSAAGFQLKGSGWYQTDFRGGSKPAAKDGGGDAPKADANDAGKTDGASAASASDSSSAKSEPSSTTSPAAPAAPAASPGAPA